MRFDKRLLDVFRALSHDRNPLHVDEDYARKTPFGGIVVYGMAAALYGLGHWARGRRFSLSRIEGLFEKPLFLGQDYEIRIREQGDSAAIQYLKGDAVQARFSFTWKAGPAKGFPDDAKGGGGFSPLRKARERSLSAGQPGAVFRAARYPYRADRGAFGRGARAFLLSPRQLPFNQLQALAWSSYFIGMEMPGRQALFSEFSLAFLEAPDRGQPFEIADLNVAFNESFRLVEAVGRGAGIESFRLCAFDRPAAVRYDFASLKTSGARRLAGKTAFVSGAGRGFGSVLAAALAAEGADVIINYRFGGAQALRLRAELGRLGSKVTLAQGDIGSIPDCRRIRSQLERQGARLDFLVNNASPAIKAQGYLEQGPDEFAAFVADSLRACSVPCRELLGLLRPSGAVIAVSTAYARDIPPRYSHYVAAKSAVEGLMKALAKEFPRVNFIVARPPRMLTDQTNSFYDPPDPLAIFRAAEELVDRLARPDADGNFREFDLLRAQPPSPRPLP